MGLFQAIRTEAEQTEIGRWRAEHQQHTAAEMAVRDSAEAATRECLDQQVPSMMCPLNSHSFSTQFPADALVLCDDSHRCLMQCIRTTTPHLQLKSSKKPHDVYQNALFSAE